MKVCEDVGLNPLTKPFDYVTIQGKTSLLANKEASSQLSRKHLVTCEVKSLTQNSEAKILECWVRASDPSGRFTDELGCVPYSEKLTGDTAANQRMKCVTKAKRRAILAHCGLGVIDETEVETIPQAQITTAETLQVTNKVSAKTKSSGSVPTDDQSVPLPPRGIFRAEQPMGSAQLADLAPKNNDSGSEVVDAEVVSEKATTENSQDTFKWEHKPDRQRLIHEIKSRFPGIGRESIITVADEYKLAGSWKVITDNLDHLLANEQLRATGSKLLFPEG